MTRREVMCYNQNRRDPKRRADTSVKNKIYRTKAALTASAEDVPDGTTICAVRRAHCDTVERESEKQMQKYPTKREDLIRNV